MSLQLFLLLVACLESFAKVAGTLKLEPSDVYTEVGGWAIFTCCIPCELVQSHTIKWILGSESNVQRLVDSDFEQRTGVQVEIEYVSNQCQNSTCENSSNPELVMLQQMKVSISSVEKMNRSAVQCAALRKSPSHSDIYSHYSIIIVNDTHTETDVPAPVTTLPTSTKETELPSISTYPIEVTSDNEQITDTTQIVKPSQCQTEPAVTYTVSQTVTNTVTVTKTVEVTNRALPKVPTSHLSDNGSTKVTAPFTLTLILAYLILLLLM